jgi:hypothetical protein
MSLTQTAVSQWRELQALQSSPGWKLTAAAPWVPALFRAAFTRTRPRVPLEEFHAATDTFLTELRRQGVQLREDASGRSYCDEWVAKRFLARPRAGGQFVYELTESSVRFLSYLDGFTSEKTNLNSSRLATLLTRVEALAHETDPDPAARIDLLKAEIAERQEQLRALEAGEAPHTLPDATALEAAHDVLDLAAGLPADFKRMRDGLERMLHSLRQEIIESNASKGITMGEILEADKKLRSTVEGRTYEGFTAFLNDGDQQARFRRATAAVLERDFTEAMSSEDRQTLYRLVADLRGQATEIQRIYGRLSESMHTYVQSDEYRESVQLRRLIRAAETAIHKAPRARRRAAVVPAPQLYGSQFESLAMIRLYNPDDHQAPPKLAAPATFSEADIPRRSPRTPQADPEALRAAVGRALQARGEATLAQVFGYLPPEHRHLNSIRALLHAALNQGALNQGAPPDPLRSEEVRFTQIDGTERIAHLPTVTFRKAASHA